MLWRISYGEAVHLPEQMRAWEQNLLCDPQTSGGLLISCSPSAASDVLSILQQNGYHRAARIGIFTAGPPEITVAA